MDLIVSFLGGALLGIMGGFWIIVAKKIEARKKEKQVKKWGIK